MTLQSCEVLLGAAYALIERIDQITNESVAHEVEKDPALTRTIRSLETKYPDLPPGLESLPGYKIIETHAEELESTYAPLYSMLNDVASFLHTAYQTLYALPSQVEALTTSRTPVLIRPYLDLIVQFGTLAALPALLPQIRPRLAIYLKLVSDKPDYEPDTLEDVIVDLARAPFTNGEVGKLRSLSTRLQTTMADIAAISPALDALTDPATAGPVLETLDARFLSHLLIIPALTPTILSVGQSCEAPAALLAIWPTWSLTPSGRYSVMLDDVFAATLGKGNRKVLKAIRAKANGNKPQQELRRFIKGFVTVLDTALPGIDSPAVLESVRSILVTSINQVTTGMLTIDRKKIPVAHQAKALALVCRAARMVASVDARLVSAPSSVASTATALEEEIETMNQLPSDIQEAVTAVQAAVHAGESGVAAWGVIEVQVAQLRGIRRGATFESIMARGGALVAAGARDIGHVAPCSPLHGSFPLRIRHALPHCRTSATLTHADVREDIIDHVRVDPGAGLALLHILTEIPACCATEAGYRDLGEAAESLASDIVQAAGDILIDRLLSHAAHVVLATVARQPIQAGTTLPPKVEAAMAQHMAAADHAASSLVAVVKDAPPPVTVYSSLVDPARLLAGRVFEHSGTFLKTLLTGTFPRPSVLLMLIGAYTAACTGLAPHLPISIEGLRGAMVTPSKAGAVVSALLRAVDPFLAIHIRGGQPSAVYNAKLEMFSPAPDQWAARQQQLMGKPTPLQEVIDQMSSAKVPDAAFRAALNAQLSACPIDQLTAPTELAGLHSVIGTEGVGVAAGELLRMAFVELPRLLSFIAKHESTLRTVRADWVAGAACPALDALIEAPALCQGLILAGGAFILRDRLLHSAGLTSVTPASMEDATDKCRAAVSNAHHHLWSLLPTALAAVTISAPAQQYIPALGGFRANAHLAPIAAVALTRYFDMVRQDGGSDAPTVSELIVLMERASLGPADPKGKDVDRPHRLLVLLEGATEYARALGVPARYGIVDPVAVELAKCELATV